MTDEELCYRLRVVGRFDKDQKQAADRIEQLESEVERFTTASVVDIVIRTTE